MALRRGCWRWVSILCVNMLGWLLCAAALAQTPAVLLEISGEVGTPLMLGREQLLALKRLEFTETCTVTQAGQEVVLSVVYQGLLLRQLLDLAGLKLGRREIRKAIVLLTAKDGYQTSFSWGELYNSQLGDGVIVVLRHGADELLDTEGFVSVRSLQDLRGGPRHVRWLTKIEVVTPVGR